MFEENLAYSHWLNSTCDDKFYVPTKSIDYGVYSCSEPAIREKYYLTHYDTKISYFQIIQRYSEATTEEERERAYQDLKEKNEEYRQFLQIALEELVELV